MGRNKVYLRAALKEMDRLATLSKLHLVGFKRAQGFCREEEAGQDPEWHLHYSEYISCFFFFSTHHNDPAPPETSSCNSFWSGISCFCRLNLTSVDMLSASGCPELKMEEMGYKGHRKLQVL